MFVGVDSPFSTSIGKYFNQNDISAFSKKTSFKANKLTFSFAFHLLKSTWFLLIVYSHTKSYFSTAHKFQNKNF